ncbi:MAG: dTDP-4-dehydrorhamnose 3,5-epimerase [Negativicutes bacterium]|nr:dTDP-4-dehydrorhamnose 3,5-epimerase [Negativicutes bacterium]
MKFIETVVKGAFIVEIKMLEDERGFFARSFCQNEFNELGLDMCTAQCNISFNNRKGTLRGMHYQDVPHQEAKLVRCTKGAIYDVIIDLRPDSSTYKQWCAIELTENNYRQIYIPKGCAHGFQTLTNNAEVFYQMSDFYYPEFSKGIRWNDPAFKIEWPLLAVTISERDKNYVLWKD